MPVPSDTTPAPTGSWGDIADRLNRLNAEIEAVRGLLDRFKAELEACVTKYATK